MNKSNLIDRIYYELIRFFYQLVVAYFFGPPRTFKRKKAHQYCTKCLNENTQIKLMHKMARLICERVLWYANTLHL